MNIAEFLLELITITGYSAVNIDTACSFVYLKDDAKKEIWWRVRKTYPYARPEAWNTQKRKVLSEG